jgi:hypothetical protein|tara:strand:- start:31 stop:399 length:369 start_codon:yes stop_codon:yes gene_type:complete
MSKVMKFVIGFVIIMFAIFIATPIEAAVDFDGKKVRVAAIKKIEAISDNELVFTLLDDIVVANVLGTCNNLSNAQKFSFIIENSFYIRKGNQFVYWNMSDPTEELCTIDSFFRVEEIIETLI